MLKHAEITNITFILMTHHIYEMNELMNTVRKVEFLIASDYIYRKQVLILEIQKKFPTTGRR